MGMMPRHFSPQRNSNLKNHELIKEIDDKEAFVMTKLLILYDSQTGNLRGWLRLWLKALFNSVKIKALKQNEVL